MRSDIVTNRFKWPFSILIGQMYTSKSYDQPSGDRSDEVLDALAQPDDSEPGCIVTGDLDPIYCAIWKAIKERNRKRKTDYDSIMKDICDGFIVK
jgi:hypothetical protein